MRSLLLGCGNSRLKKVQYRGQSEWSGELTTLDMDPACGADVVFDLERLCIPMRDRLHGMPVLPFEDGTFDELAAYDVLEHFGQQGDWRSWFTEMAEYHRILKPGGTFGIIVPIGEDAVADPGHSRFIHTNHFMMLNQQWYADRLAAGAQITSYRWYWTLNFEVRHLERHGDHHLSCVLEKA
jgi:cyclopropane fatty-acyl-phospholipid synthase-like methyltransferase